jgi:hypothetical protein
MENNTIDPIDQIEQIREMFKGFKQKIDDESDDSFIPQTVYFYNSKMNQPLAFINMPPFDSEQKPMVFKMAFGSLRFFQTDRMLMSADIWMNTTMQPTEMKEWYDAGKSLSEHPTSEQALMITMYDKDGGIYSSVDMYGRDDDGNLYWKDDTDYRHEDWKNAEGLVPDLVKYAYDQLYDENYVVDSKDVNQYFGMISDAGFEVNMSNMMFNALGLDDHEHHDE